MSVELFFWVTISSLLFTIILFFRKSLVQDFVSMSTVIVLYATGTFGNIYNHLFFLPEDALLHDALYLLIVMSIITGAQVMSELLVNMVNGEFDIKVTALNTGEIILSWIGIYIIVYLYLLLWEYSAPIICSIIIPCGIFISALSRVISDKNFKDADDYLTINFVLCIFLFGGLWWFNTLIGRPEIIRAFGIFSPYYSTAASLIPAIMLCLPFIIGLSKIRVSNLLNKIEDDDNNDDVNKSDLDTAIKSEIDDEKISQLDFVSVGTNDIVIPIQTSPSLGHNHKLNEIIQLVSIVVSDMITDCRALFGLVYNPQLQNDYRISIYYH